MTGDRAVTKDEIDVEKHFLGQTVRLSDGTEGLVFSRGQRNPHQFIYNCHLCGVANLPGERCLQTHISGRKHQTKFQQPIIDAISFRAPLVQKPKIQMNIAPGEPVPPGFEDEVRPMAQIQNTLHKYKETALIGIEYCVELNINDDRELGYICLLCDKRGNSKTIISHWASYNHRLKYLEKHYPMVIKELVPVRYNPEARNIMPKIIESVCEAIEDHHGRLMPVVCDNNDFKRKRNAIYQEIMADKHFDEKSGPNFINAINKSLIDELKGDKNREPSPPSVKAPKRKPGMSGFDRILLSKRKDRNSLDSISSDSSTSLNNLQLNRNRTRSRSNDRLGGNSNKIVKHKKSQSPAFRILPRVQRSPPFGELHDTKNDKKKNSLPTPKELSLQASEIAQERYKWEKYRCMLEIATQDLEKSLKNYEKNPEKHPLYPEEWKQFWNRRYKELQAEKKDPNKYDFKPEWVIFWTKRMKELHDDEIDKKKKELRKRLMLPDDAEERTNELKEQYKIKTTSVVNKLSATQSKQSQKSTVSVVRDKTKSSAAVIDISDDEDLLDRPSKSSSSKRSADKSRSFSRSLSPISDDNDRRRKQSRYTKEHEHRSRDYSRERDRDYHRSRSRDREIERLRERERERDRERYPVLGLPPTGEYYHRPRMILPPGAHPHPFGPRGYYPPPHQQPPNVYSFRSMDSYNYPKYEPDAKAKAKESEPQDDGPLTVVAVLRLLTALEEHLGSLGPKVVDLLSKALALEKVKANSADDMLTNDDHCVFFETVKEKLKGQLIADVLDSNKVKTVKRAIKNIAAIIHQVSEKHNSATNTKSTDDDNKTEEEKQEENNKNNNKKIGNKELPFDRQLISSKLAAGLVMQERTDITKDEMDKLIYVFILMVKLSKERETTVSVQDMLIELGIISPPPQITENIIEEDDIEDEIPLDMLESIGGSGQHQPNSNDAFEETTEIPASVDQHEDEEDDANQQSGVGDLESLTDSDLQTLLQNFKHLSSEEQHHLISHLKKLESTNPLRVEKLRKFVNIADLKNEVDKSKNEKNNFTNIKMKITNPINNNNNKKLSPKKHINIFSDDDYDDDDDDNKLQKMIDSDDEDDDYNFDDVVKAASKNINRRNTDDDNISHRSNHSHQRIDSINRDNIGIGDISNMSKASSSVASTSTANLGMSLADTQNLIANLMGSLQKSTGQFVNNSSENNKTTNMKNTPSDVNATTGMKKTIPTLVNAGKTTNHGNVAAPFYQQPLQHESIQQQQPNMQMQQQQQQQAMPMDYQQQMVQGQQFGYNNMYYQNYNMPQDYNSQTNALNYNYDYTAQNSQQQQQQPYNFQNFGGQTNYMLPQQQQQRK